MEIFSEKRTGPKVEPPFRYLVYCFEEWHRTNLAKKLRKHGVKTRPLVRPLLPHIPLGGGGIMSPQVFQKAVCL